MGLKTDIANAYKKSAGLPENVPHPKVDSLAGDLEKAVEKFVLSQEFRVAKLTTKVDVESIKTTDTVDVNVDPATLMGPYGPMLKFVKKMINTITGIPGVGEIAAPLDEAYKKLENAIQVAANRVAGAGASLPAPNFKKDQKIPGKGGSLMVDGTSNIKVPNYKNSSNATGLAAKSVVKLFKGEVNGKG